MAAYVVDASVAIKWVIPEPGTEAALALLGHELIAPDLWVAECADILWRKQRLGEISAQEAGLAARLLERAEIDLVPMRRLLDRATALAIALDHPAYDATYLALAETTGRTFVTADPQLARKAAGGAARVLTLTDFAA